MAGRLRQARGEAVCDRFAIARIPALGDFPISAASIYFARGEFWAAADAVALTDWIYAAVWCAVAIGLVIFDRRAWRGPARPEATTPGRATGERATGDAATA